MVEPPSRIAAAAGFRSVKAMAESKLAGEGLVTAAMALRVKYRVLGDTDGEPTVVPSV